MNTNLQLDYAALATAAVAQSPFRHIVVKNFLPPLALARVHAELPKLERGGSFPPEALKLGPAARDLMDEMEGPILKNLVAEKFGLVLHDSPNMLTMRVYCRDRDGQIHTDSLAKRVTILLYLNPDQPAFTQQEGCLRLLEDYEVEIPPTNGTLLVFPNGPTTWHGHRPYVGPRFSLQLNYMTNDAKARSELRRHRLSALIKRLAA
jgi:hypothetical protein